MRIVFFGTSEFAVLSLEKILKSRHQAAAVITQPTRPSGRGQRPTPSPVHRLVSSLTCTVKTKTNAITIFQPEKPDEPGFVQELRKLRADCGVIVAYGGLLPKSVLELFPKGAINLHPSLLPKFRGAAPIQWALIQGEEKTGISVFRLDEQLDHGPVLLQAECPIEPQDSAASLTAKLAEMGADMLVEALTKLEQGTISGTPQDDAQATYAPRLKKEDGILNWSKDCQSLHNLVRGVQLWPGAATWWNATMLKLIATRPDPSHHDSSVPSGTVVSADPCTGLRVQTGKGSLWILRLQRAGGKPMEAAEFLRGRPIPPGTTLHASAPNQLP